MKHRMLLLVGAIILLVTLPCNVPSRRPELQLPSGTGTPEQPTCTSQVPASDASLRWYDGTSLIYVPAGKFAMGVQGGQDNPLHEVLLDDFWIYQTEVTNGMYALCVAAGGCTPPAVLPSYPDVSQVDYQAPEFADRPIVSVTWAQADTYCKWMNARLPTEAEWEKSARGTDARTYAWGEDQPDCDRLNYNNCVGAPADVLDYPTSASPYKALNTAGNASEWVSDWYKASYYAESPAVNPQGPVSGTARSVRGGSFASAAEDVRTFTRASEDPLKSRGDLGFRCVVLDAQCFAPSCETSATLTRIPRTPKENACEPPAVNVSVATYCQRKLAYANLDPHGGYLAFQESTKCNQAGDIYTCTGPESSSFTVKACTSCTPPTLVPTAPQKPSCAPGYQFDESTCRCKYLGSTSTLNTSCPSLFAAVYVPAQQCCQPQSGPSRLNLELPSNEPGMMAYDCSGAATTPVAPEPVVKCEIVTVDLPQCTSAKPGCVEKQCPVGTRTKWDPNLCCCADVAGVCH